MMFPFSPRARRLAAWFVFELAVLAGAAVLSVWADTSSRVRAVSAGNCYCGCATSKTSAGCVRMCELPKYASRWWAITCAKPRVISPADTPGAGPRVPHPARAERASR